MATGEDQWPIAPDPEEPEPGKYLIAYLRARCIERFSRRDIEVDFEIVEPVRWAKKVVKLYFPTPLETAPSPASKYYQAWCFANDGRPERGDRMTPHVFAGYWRAELTRTQRTTTRSGGIRKLEAGEKGRIRVDHLIERVAGSAPRASSRRGK